MTTVFMPGRWQPFHMEHFNNLMELVKKYDKVVVGIRDMRPDRKNVFGKDFIAECIATIIKAEGLEGKVQYCAIPGSPKHELYAQRCEEWSGGFDVIAAGNPQLKTPFKKRYPIHHFKRRGKISATDIRKRLKKGRSLAGLVHPAIEKLVACEYTRIKKG